MRKLLVLSAAVVSFVLSGAAFSYAHEMILKPSKPEAAKGETLAIELQSTHKFIIKEEVENISVIKAGLFSGGSLKEAALRANDPELRIDFDVTMESDGAALVLANKDGEIYSVTNEGSMVGNRKELEAKGLRVVRASKTDKFAKAIVNASAGDDGFSTVVGQELEVVPVTNPADVKVGEYFNVKILYKGQPASMPVLATYDGFSDLNVTYAYYTESAADGVAKIKITAPGFWIVRAATTGEPGVEGEYDARNLASIMSFTVK